MAIDPGWPCAALPLTPPSVEDKLSAPTGDDIAGQIAGVLTPRGPAWGTDEAGDGQGASPVMRRLWLAIAKWSADIYARDFQAAVQAFPSAITDALADWEEELGLPDPGFVLNPTEVARKTAVQAKHRATGGASKAYFVCLAKAAGFDITISEAEAFRAGLGRCGTTRLGVRQQYATWIVHVTPATAVHFRAGISRAGERLTDFVRNEALESLLRRHAPEHTILVFRYSTGA